MEPGHVINLINSDTKDFRGGGDRSLDGGKAAELFCCRYNCVSSATNRLNRTEAARVRGYAINVAYWSIKKGPKQRRPLVPKTSTTCGEKHDH